MQLYSRLCLWSSVLVQPKHIHVFTCRLANVPITARCSLQTGFFHRNSVFQAHVDVPLNHFATKQPQIPHSVRLVLTAELCASLAAHDPAEQPTPELVALLDQAQEEALNDRCQMPDLQFPSVSKIN
jgi:hypothetical protein